MREDWLQKRVKGIGGSDAAAVCGLSPWKSPYQVWLEKRGEAQPSEDNEPMFWGRTLEPVIRQRYADVTGRTVTVPQDVLVHPNYDWMLASLDGLTDDRVVEIKTSRSPQGWGEPGTNEIPDVYMIQVQHYMTVTKLSMADVVALIGGSDFRIYEVPADSELQDLILDRESAFWEMVKAGTPPDPTTFADLKQRFGAASKAQTVQASPEVIAAVGWLKEIKKITSQEEDYKAMIMAHLKEADTLIDGDKVLATWRAQKGAKRFDSKAFQEAEPEIYKQFVKEGEPSRRLLIK